MRSAATAWWWRSAAAWWATSPGSLPQPICAACRWCRFPRRCYLWWTPRWAATLATLDEREWACGCAEIAKSAVIDSDDFFFWLVDAAGALAARDEVVVEEAIARSVVFKADVVAADKSESKGVRECLNYGHTLGHAVESLAGYGAFSHGAAVAEGMRFAARMAVSLVDAPLDLVETQDSLLDQLGLPALDWSAEPEAMLEAMKRDKKARRGQVRFVLPRDVGSWQLADVDDATILDHLNAWARSKA